MKPITQTTFGWPHGNCYAACVASILEIPIEACPVVAPDQDWNMVWNAWFKQHGLARLTFGTSKGFRPNGYYIACGPTPRELFNEQGERVHHAVVAYDNAIVHDPHPEQRFLQEMTEADVIYRLDPAGLISSPEAHNNNDSFGNTAAPRFSPDQGRRATHQERAA